MWTRRFRDVLTLIEAGSDVLRATARARTDGEYRRRFDELIPKCDARWAAVATRWPGALWSG